MGMMPPNQQIPQPPQQGQGQGQMPEGGSLTDPTALYALMGDPSAMDKIQQNPDSLQPNQNPQDQSQEEPPEEIVTYEDAIDAILGLIVKHTKANLNADVQSKAIASLAQAAHQLQQASDPERVQIDMQGQLDQQQVQMQMEKHQQELLHQQQLHDQTLKHNDLNQALKEWQIQQQQQQQGSKQSHDMQLNQEQHDANMAKQMQEMAQGQEMHDANLESQAQEKPIEGEE